MGSEDGMYCSMAPYTTAAHLFRCSQKAVESISESVLNGQIASACADGFVRLCDSCSSLRVRNLPRTKPLFSVKHRLNERGEATTEIVFMRYTVDMNPEAAPTKKEEQEHPQRTTKADETTVEADKSTAALTTLEYCPDPRNAKLIAFGGRGCNIVFVAQVDYALPYLS